MFSPTEFLLSCALIGVVCWGWGAYCGFGAAKGMYEDTGKKEE